MSRNKYIMIAPLFFIFFSIFCSQDRYIGERDDIKKYETIIKSELGDDYEIIKRKLILNKEYRNQYNPDYEIKSISMIYPFFLIKNKNDNKIDIACGCINVNDRLKPASVVILKHDPVANEYKVLQKIFLSNVTECLVVLYYGNDGLYLSFVGPSVPKTYKYSKIENKYLEHTMSEKETF